MEDMEDKIYILSMILSLASIGGCAAIANNREHSVVKWVIYGMLFGPFALIGAVFMKKRARQSDTATLDMPLPPGANEADR